MCNWLVVLLIGSTLGCIQTQAQNTQASSLQLSLTPTSKPASFLVSLHNLADNDLNLKMGIALGNGQKQYIDIQLALKTPDGRILHLQLKGPAYIAGRVDPSIVPLPVGATFSFPINLEDCISLKEKIWKMNLAPGHYSLEAQYTGTGMTQLEANLDMKGVALMSFWTGTVSSSPTAFTVPPDKK
jgi:hypothetical protein